MLEDLSTAEYCCPGETCRISRAVHLGRLAGFHPTCRDCPSRDDTAGLSSRQIRHLAEVGLRATQPPLFYAEGVGNVRINDLSPNVARRIAIEFARRLATPDPSQSPHLPSQPAVVVAGDGRLATASILAAIIEGVRWTGCEVIDLGPASAPCTARTIQHLAAEGGIFVGNAHSAPQLVGRTLVRLGGLKSALHTVGLKFWAHGEPLSQGGLLDDVAAAMQTGSGAAMIDRPARAFGALRRFSAAEVYLSDFRPAYHALRPLRFVLDCPLGPLVAYVEELIRTTACWIIFSECGIGDRVGCVERTAGEMVGFAQVRAHCSFPFGLCVERTAGEMVGFARRRTPGNASHCSGPVRATHQRPGSSVLHPPYDEKSELGQQVAAAHVHFGMQIGDDGENCQVVDERGQSVATERLLSTIAGSIADPVAQGSELRQQTFRRMQESRIPIAADTSGRLWYASGHAAAPDALQTLTRLLVLLSRNDLAFSAVLDQESPVV